jgi:hypothetical protein
MTVDDAFRSARRARGEKHEGIVVQRRKPARKKAGIGYRSTRIAVSIPHAHTRSCRRLQRVDLEGRKPWIHRDRTATQQPARGDIEQELRGVPVVQEHAFASGDSFPLQHGGTRQDVPLARRGIEVTPRQGFPQRAHTQVD